MTGPLEHMPLRLHIDELRLEGVAARVLGPMMQDEVAAAIEQALGRLVAVHGAPPLAVTGPLRLDGATVRLTPGQSGDEVVAAIAQQLYEQIYGPLDPLGRPPEPIPGQSGHPVTPMETTR